MFDFNKISEEKYEEILTLHRELCVIPAPSNHEEKRVEFILKYLKSIGYENAYADDVGNVICILGNPQEKMVAFMAHSDTVFPEETKLEYIDDGEKIYCPGAGDDTASLVVMLIAMKYLKENNISPKRTLMFVANSCEEGLGNLKGTRRIFEEFGNRIEYMYTFDSHCNSVCAKSVGSHRYKVTVETEGGHSFTAFGNRNAIYVLSEIINEIYKIEVPVIGDSCTTYNVGIINGGTSVNTIAQSAWMLCEYRSDNIDCMEEMKNKYLDIFEKAKEKCIDVKVELIGNRPCMSNDMDFGKLDIILNRVTEIQSKHFGSKTIIESGSTDCNIPHSLGIPAVALSNYNGGGTHTLEEWILKESLKPGFGTTLELILLEGQII